MQVKKLFINGKWVDGQKKKTFETFNPATGEVVARLTEAEKEDVDYAVTSSRIAYAEVWSKTNAAERGRILYKIADLIEASTAEIAKLDAMEAGKPYLDCEFDIPACVDIFRFQAGLSDKIQGSTYSVQQGMTAFTKREPYGVIAAIVPWNYPIYNACLKVAPILATGNCCVLKPAELTSLSALRLAEIAKEAGLPDGVFNVITGRGEITGAALAEHSDVDMISFTGSTEVGRSIMCASAKSNLKKLSLELGGKSPYIIFDDANIEQAVDSAALTIFFNQGQTCTAGSRLLVQKSIKEKVEKMLAEKAKKIVIGDPFDEKTQLGSIISKTQYEKILSYIEIGKKCGAKLLCGGKALSVAGMEKGLFIQPTIFTNVTNDMQIAMEEIFGPVLSIIEFTTEEEAVKLANKTTYGLATSVWTGSSSRILRMASAIDAGIFWGNCVAKENPVVPVGGFKQSGFGKEGGAEAGLEYTRQKTVWLNMSDDVNKWIN